MRPQRYMVQDPRSGNWLYRRIYPGEIGKIDGSKAFVRSFATTDLSAALRKWSTFDAEFEKKVDDAKRMAVFIQEKDARREKFWLSVARWIEFERARNGGRLLKTDEMAIPTAIRVFSHTFFILRNAFLEWAREHDPDAAAVYTMGDTRLDMLFECGLIGAWFTAYERQNIETGQKSVTPVEVGTPLSTVLTKFKQEKRRSLATYKAIEQAIDLFEQACGETVSVEAANKEHMRKFRDYLVRRDDLRGRTKNKIRANLSSIFSHAQTLFLIEHNPVELIKTFDQSDSEKRKPFSDTDLKAIFGDKFGPDRGPALYWIPLISLYTAARQGEIAQLDRRDVDVDPDTGLLVFRFTEEGEDQSIKNEGSIRTIPVPQALLDLGFEKFVRSVKSGPLFGLKRSPSGGFPNLSSDLNEMIRDAGIEDPLKVFHSFRHTTRTKARSFETTEEAMDYISGHAPVNVGRRYGLHELPTLKRHLDKINYPIEIAKWTRLEP
jgi:integrase